MHFYMHSYLHKNFILVKSGCYIGNGRDLFCLLTTVEMGNGMRSMGRRLGRFLKMMGAAFGVASAPEMVPMMLVTMGDPPPSGGLTWEALIRWGDDAISGGYGG
jgi:hypothetical protein